MNTIKLLLIVLSSMFLGYKLRDVVINMETRRLFISCGKHIPTEDELFLLSMLNDDELEEWLCSDKELSEWVKENGRKL